jgi:hypothetical protein
MEMRRRDPTIDRNEFFKSEIRKEIFVFANHYGGPEIQLG